MQPLKIYHAWKIERNRFIEMDWETADPQEMREYLTDDLLLLKHAFDNSIQIHLSWEPAGDPQGRFVLKVIDDDKKKPVELIPPEVLKRWWIGSRRLA